MPFLRVITNPDITSRKNIPYTIPLQDRRGFLFRLSFFSNLSLVILFAATFYYELSQYIQNYQTGVVFILNNGFLISGYRSLISAILSIFLAWFHWSRIDLLVIHREPRCRHKVRQVGVAIFPYTAAYFSTCFMWALMIHFIIFQSDTLAKGFFETASVYGQSSTARLNLNLMQSSHECCGLQGAYDFENLPRSAHAVGINVTAFALCDEQCVPVSCCASMFCSNQIRLMTNTKKGKPSASTLFHSTGCMEKLRKDLITCIVIITVYSAICILEIVAFISSQILLTAWASIAEAEADEDSVCFGFILPCGSGNAKDLVQESADGETEGTDTAGVTGGSDSEFDDDELDDDQRKELFLKKVAALAKKANKDNPDPDYVKKTVEKAEMMMKAAQCGKEPDLVLQDSKPIQGAPQPPVEAPGGEAVPPPPGAPPPQPADSPSPGSSPAPTPAKPKDESPYVVMGLPPGFEKLRAKFLKKFGNKENDKKEGGEGEKDAKESGESGDDKGKGSGGSAEGGKGKSKEGKGGKGSKEAKGTKLKDKGKKGKTKTTTTKKTTTTTKGGKAKKGAKSKAKGKKGAKGKTKTKTKASKPKKTKAKKPKAKKKK